MILLIEKQTSPQSLVEMTTDFLRNLGAIAPTHVILGNHDGNLRNDNRQDAITPIVEAMEDPNIFLHKFSTEVEVNIKDYTQCPFCVRQRQLDC